MARPLPDHVTIESGVVLEARAGQHQRHRRRRRPYPGRREAHRQAGDHHHRRLPPLRADDPDATGTTIKIEGDLRAEAGITIRGGNSADTISIETTALLLGNTTIKAGAGADSILVDRLQSMTTYQGLDVDDDDVAGTAGYGVPDFTRDGTGRILRDELTIDGEGGTDAVVVNINGVSDYVMNVRDSGGQR